MTRSRKGRIVRLGASLAAVSLIAAACGGDDAVEVLRLQRAGKGAQEAEVFLNGWPIAEGTILGGRD